MAAARKIIQAGPQIEKSELGLLPGANTGHGDANILPPQLRIERSQLEWGDLRPDTLPVTLIAMHHKSQGSW